MYYNLQFYMNRAAGDMSPFATFGHN